MERTKPNKAQKRSAIIFAILFCIIVFIGSIIYPYIGYILPWNKKTITYPVQQIARTQNEAIEMSTTIIKGKVINITPNQYDTNTTHVYSLIEFQVDEVLKGEPELKGTTIDTFGLGGTYKGITSTYENAKAYKLNEEMIILLNDNNNLEGEPYSQLIKKNDKYIAFDTSQYTIEEFKALLASVISP